MATEGNPPSIPEATPVPKTAPIEAARTFSQDEVNKLLGERAQRAADGARAQLIGKFKDFGVTSDDELAALVKTAHDLRQSQMTELQKAQDKTKALEADLARAKSEASARGEDLRRSRVFRENSVAPEYEDVLGVLLDRAKTDKPQDFDEVAWLEGIKKQRPMLFGQPQTAAPSAGAPAPVGATTGAIFPQLPAATLPQGGMPQFDARTATTEDLRRWEQQMGIHAPTSGRI